MEYVFKNTFSIMKVSEKEIHFCENEGFHFVYVLRHTLQTIFFVSYQALVGHFKMFLSFLPIFRIFCL